MLKTKAIKELTPPLSFFLSLSLSLSTPLDDHEIYPKISLSFNIQQSWTLTKLKLKVKKKKNFFILFFYFFFIFYFFFFTTAYTWEAAWCTCESCGLTLRIVSSIGELLLLIYKSGFYRWEQKQPSKDNHDSYSNQIHKPHRSSRG